MLSVKKVQKDIGIIFSGRMHVNDVGGVYVALLF